MAEPIKAGWEDVGYGGLVRKTDGSGQMVDYNHPEYTNYQAPTAPVSPPIGGTPGSGQLPGEAQPITPPQAPAAPTTTAAGNPINSTTEVLNNPVAQGPPTTVSGAFQQALMSRLTPGPVDSQSPEIAPAIQANKLAEQRGLEQNRAMLAERAGAQGLDQNAFNTQLTGLAEGRAAREGQFAGQMTADLARQRQQDITAALALGGNMLSEQDRLALQREMGTLDAQLRREGYGLQTSLANQEAGLRREGYGLQERLGNQEIGVRREGLAAQTGLGNREIDLRGELGRGQLNLGLLGQMLNNQQFGQSLGLQAGMGEASLNQQALLSLLNGL